MSTKVIVIGINRSGTKLASYQVARACALRTVSLEPFYWDGGIDTSQGEDWKPQIIVRNLSKKGRKEHKRLPVYCDETTASPFLKEVLCTSQWDLVKFVEIGRAKVYHALCPEALCIGLIRDPIGQFCSLRGATIPKDYVVAQWKRLQKKEDFSDPLPDADNWLSKDMAACARLYAALYTRLKNDLPQGSLRVSFKEITESPDWLKTVADTLGLAAPTPFTMPMLGISTKQELPANEHAYIADKLTPVYNKFLAP
jgi:hypothetical protein